MRDGGRDDVLIARDDCRGWNYYSLSKYVNYLILHNFHNISQSGSYV